MNYNFFANRTDKIDVLEFIFSETDLCIYDSYSGYSENICEYETVAEIDSKFDLENGGQFASTFQLWSPRHKGNPSVLKIDLDPKSCEGHTFRHATSGWGMIQLYFGGLRKNRLEYSHIGHFNEKRALLEESITPDSKDRASDWDWSEIRISSRKLKYHIHNRLAQRKVGSLGQLNGAFELEKMGIEMSYFTIKSEPR